MRTSGRAVTSRWNFREVPQPRTAETDHPRAGGEHISTDPSISLHSGSSPRWRGTPPGPLHPAHPFRIIPALAGNTVLTRRWPPGLPDHPRAGGEHDLQAVAGGTDSGSSPRWRGNTSVAHATQKPVEDHPRAGGEHASMRFLHYPHRGSSPRWRGTPGQGSRGIRRRRIIPALAGNTPSVPSSPSDHPRAGGEHVSHSQGRRELHRIIPALAGNTRRENRPRPLRTDHPRAGGEHAVYSSKPRGMFGSSPRWRGTLSPQRGLQVIQRIIPALAGNTALPYG